MSAQWYFLLLPFRALYTISLWWYFMKSLVHDCWFSYTVSLIRTTTLTNLADRLKHTHAVYISKPIRTASGPFRPPFRRIPSPPSGVITSCSIFRTHRYFPFIPEACHRCIRCIVLGTESIPWIRRCICWCFWKELRLNKESISLFDVLG